MNSYAVRTAPGVHMHQFQTTVSKVADSSNSFFDALARDCVVYNVISVNTVGDSVGNVYVYITYEVLNVPSTGC